jgi:hypothetical protein
MEKANRWRPWIPAYQGNDGVLIIKENKNFTAEDAEERGGDFC